MHNSLNSGEIPLKTEDDLADLIACLLHANAADARYRVVAPRAQGEANGAEFDRKLTYRIERFILSRK